MGSSSRGASVWGLVIRRQQHNFSDLRILVIAKATDGVLLFNTRWYLVLDSSDGNMSIHYEEQILLSVASTICVAKTVCMQSGLFIHTGEPASSKDYINQITTLEVECTTISDSMASRRSPISRRKGQIVRSTVKDASPSAQGPSCPRYWTHHRNL